MAGGGCRGRGADLSREIGWGGVLSPHKFWTHFWMEPSF